LLLHNNDNEAEHDRIHDADDGIDEPGDFVFETRSLTAMRRRTARCPAQAMAAIEPGTSSSATHAGTA